MRGLGVSIEHSGGPGVGGGGSLCAHVVSGGDSQELAWVRSFSKVSAQGWYQLCRQKCVCVGGGGVHHPSLLVRNGNLEPLSGALAPAENALLSGACVHFPPWPQPWERGHLRERERVAPVPLPRGCHATRIYAPAFLYQLFPGFLPTHYCPISCHVFSPNCHQSTLPLCCPATFCPPLPNRG